MTYMRHARRAMMLAGSAALVGCGGAESATALAPVDPGPRLESRWDLTVTLRYVRASSELTGDGRTVPGTVNPREYQYKGVGTLGGNPRFYFSSDYGSVSGTSYELGAGVSFNFADRDWSYTHLKAGDLVRLTLYSTE